MYFTLWAAALCKNTFLHFCVAALEKQSVPDSLKAFTAV
jgi:hypothetical protein